MTEQRSLLEDEWLLILGGAAVLCGVLSALNHGFPERLFASRAPVAQMGREEAAPLAAPVPAASPATAAAQPAASAAPAALSPRMPGRWVVDQRGGADARSIGEALASAQPGETIVVRPGTYAEGLQITKSLTLTGEEGSAPPTILGTGASTLSIVGAEVTLANLSIAHKPNPGDQTVPAVLVKNGALNAKKLEIEELDPAGVTNDACLALSHARLELKGDSVLGGCAMGIVGSRESKLSVSGTRFANIGKIGVSVLENSEGSVENSSFLRVYAALGVGQGATLRARSVQIAEGNRGLEAFPDSTAVLEDAEITDQKSAAVLVDSANVVRVENSRLIRNGYGIAVSHRAKLNVSGTKILDSLKEPYHWSKADNVQLSGGGNDPELPN